MSSMIEMLDGANKYSAEKFEKFLKETKYHQLGNDEEKLIVNEPIIIDGRDFKKSHFYFLNIHFQFNVIFQNFNFGQGFIFELCEFGENLGFKDCTSINEKLGSFSTRKESLGIIRCKISGCLSLENCDLKNGFITYGFEDDPSSAGSLKIEGGKIGGFLSLENSSFEESMGIFYTEILGYGLRLENAKVGGTLRISPNKCKDISFSGRLSSYIDDVFILGQNLDSVVFNHGEFHGEVSIEEISIDEKLSIFGTVFRDSFIVSASESPNRAEFKNLEINIQDSQFNNGFSFTSKNSPTEILNLNFSEKSSGVIDFRNTFFKEVHLKGINFNNSLFFRDCSFNKLIFSHFFNKALVSINNNKPIEKESNPNELLIENSNLGNTEFYDFDFTVYPTIRITDSRLDNIFTNGVEWFRQDQLQVEESESDPKKILSQKREIYRQLKLAAEKQSDRITALEFKAKEVETHRLFLELGKVKKADSWAILAGKTNDHGQNWIKPLQYIILISLGFFFPLYFTADPGINFWPDFSIDGWNLFWEKFSDHSKILPQLFNPARRVSDMFDQIQYPFWVYILDGLQRIFLAFFIFQIVSAFRKFVK